MDIISQFPEDLLVRILSFIPTKHAIVTSLLSRRWRSLWTLVPKLEYDDYNTNQQQRFPLFVYRFLNLNRAPVLERLKLRIYNLGQECQVPDFGIWIGIAVSRRVRELEVIVPFPQRVSISLPSNLYTCETLESLSLNTTNCVLVDVPFAIRLPSLRKLHLWATGYPDHASLHRLLSGCPNLEDLELIRFGERNNLIRDADNTKDFTIAVPSLKRLSVFDRGYGSLSTGHVIDAPSLRYLKVHDNLLYKFRRMENMPELVTARVEVTNGVTKKFLKALSCASGLYLCLTLSEVMSPSEMIFHQLVQLTLSTCPPGWWDLLTHMLQYSPNLQILTLISTFGLQAHPTFETPNWWKQPSCVPVCLLNVLRNFKWIGYGGRQGDREVATYVLMNATRLKTATFTPESTDDKDKYRMLKELASVPTPSPTCQLLFD